jgi:hypothetical protein
MNDTTETKKIPENDRWRWLHQKLTGLMKRVGDMENDVHSTTCVIADLEASLAPRLDILETTLVGGRWHQRLLASTSRTATRV